MVWKPDGRKRVEGTCVPSQIRILGWGNWQHLMALVDVSGQAIWRQLFWLRILCIGTLVTYGLTRMAVPVESVSAISVVRCGCGEWRDLSGVKVSFNFCRRDLLYSSWRERAREV
ncbi:hypothetical protein LIPSTDRAFT_325435 [Lipomyces starkeyi NRRL Y-11557]|uniref:Uncharacterized protein n=1 Tax=Lipomyces starkeyi NRRL Y-11557 TaxID=675824 RepID=A0A1E3Q1S3_LIPST|nr:hypothetical protein LIPSTDRAFT_325435 [Lipomyces starkeyi NRRL Y-11557]